uniref:RING-type domain-containing protein n=1 Tax=Strongyloides papillosus TaxID=174720 RepID=A0A0N5BNP2_STREA
MAPRRNTLNSNLSSSSSSSTSRNTRSNESVSNAQSFNNLRQSIRNREESNADRVNELRRSRRIANLQPSASNNITYLIQRQYLQDINDNVVNNYLNESENVSSIDNNNSRNNNRQNINRNNGRRNVRNSNTFVMTNPLDSRRNRRHVFHLSTSFNPSSSNNNSSRQRRDRIRANINRSIFNSATSYNIINLNDDSQRRRLLSRQPLWRGMGSTLMTFEELVPARRMINALFSPTHILGNNDEEWPRTTDLVSSSFHRDVSSDDTMDDLVEERRYPRRSSYNETRRRIRSYATNIRRRRNTNFSSSIRFFSSFPLQVPREGLEERLASIFPQGTSTLDIRNRQIMESPKPFPVPKDEIGKSVPSEPEKCTICFEDICVDPVKCLHCRQQIGCFDCLKKWIRADAYVNSNQEEYVMHSKNMACPLCRHEWSYASRPEVFRLQNK